MNGRDLLEGISFVDEQLVDEAEKEMIRKSSGRAWMNLATLAACVCVVLLGAMAYRNLKSASTLTPTEATLAEENEPTWASATEAATAVPTEAPMADATEAGKPSVIMRVDTWQENGFIGTVEDIVNMPDLSEGEQVFVVIGEEAMAQLPFYENDPAGTIRVEVLPYTYDVENNMLYVELVTPIE